MRMGAGALPLAPIPPPFMPPPAPPARPPLNPVVPPASVLPPPPPTYAPPPTWQPPGTPPPDTSSVHVGHAAAVGGDPGDAVHRVPAGLGAPAARRGAPGLDDLQQHPDGASAAA